MTAPIADRETRPPVFRIVGRPTAQGLTWVWAQDDLDMATVAAARTQLHELLDGDTAPRCVLVYLGDECFVDVRGLRLLLAVAEQIRRRDGHLAVVAPPYCLSRMAQCLNLGEELPLLQTARHAVRWAHRRGA